jgi:type I restriction enzyme S subunit
LARDDDFRGHAIRSMTGTSGRQRAQADVIAAYSVALPKAPELWRQLGATIDPLFERIASNANESRTLAQTRDLLLPKLMAGEIRLRDAEKIAGKAL